MKITLSFGTYNGTIAKYQYGNGRTALEIVQIETGKPLMIPTINLPETHLEKNEILIKNWSENEGVLESLIKANVIKDTGRTVRTGFVQANVCILLPEENWRK